MLPPVPNPQLLAPAAVSWNRPVAAPGTSNVIMAVFRAFAFADTTNPDVIRPTANSGDSTVPVAILCNVGLFVLLLLFMIFSNRVPRIVGLLSNPNGRSHFSGCPAKTLRQNALVQFG